MQLAPTTPPATPGPVLADFNYVIRGPHQMPRMGHIEARAWPSAPRLLPGGTSFDDAVRAAQAVAATPIDDGIHRLKTIQAQGVLQAADGAFSIVPLGGDHRGAVGPVFVDGVFFDATALSLQVTRKVAELVAVVGAQRVLDLRRTGAGFIESPNPNPTAPAIQEPAA